MFEKSRALLDRLLALRRDTARLAAEQLAVLAEFAALDRTEGDPEGEFTHLEVAAVARVSERYARDWLALAETLTTRLPQTFQALRDGVLDEHKAKRVMLATDVLSDEKASQVEQTLIPRADQWNSRQLNDRLRRAVIRADPQAAAARAEAKRAARRVTHETLDDGGGQLQVSGDVERTGLAHRRIRTIARQIKSTGDDRTLDQISADVALDCLAGHDFDHAKVHVWLTIPATTALGVDDKPVEVAGYGWLPAQRALQLAAREDATWQRVLTDSATGHVLDVGRHRYRPPAALRDHLRASYPTCTGPGCLRPAHLCDQDHLVPFPAGATDSENVRPACRPHHRVKTHGGWRVERTAGLGLVWVTKHGYRFPYVREPIADPENRMTRPA
jgi:hypothetical protein